MYDFNTKKTIICDIDFYSRLPYTNNLGRMWGSSRFMSPEEFELGAAIDEGTNVYLLSALKQSATENYGKRNGNITTGLIFYQVNNSFFKWYNYY